MPTVTSPYVQQEFQVLYMKIDHNLMTEVQSISISRTDGGADVETLVRDIAGRVKGAAKSTINFSGVVPYLPPDTGGNGFDSGGMVTGKGVQLDATILSNLNQNGNLPVQFIIMLGNPAAQKLFFKGFINTINTDVAVGKQVNFSCVATGSFSTFQDS